MWTGEAILWRHRSGPLARVMEAMQQPLRSESRPGANFVVTGGTAGCHIIITCGAASDDKVGIKASLDFQRPKVVVNHIGRLKLKQNTKTTENYSMFIPHRPL